MKMWEKAKERFPGISKNDFIFDTCPSELGMKDMECPKSTYVNVDLCTQCWERVCEGEEQE